MGGKARTCALPERPQHHGRGEARGWRGRRPGGDVVSRAQDTWSGKEPVGSQHHDLTRGGSWHTMRARAVRSAGCPGGRAGH